MGKKRKAGGRPAQKQDAPMRTKYSIAERFEDSEDEFQTNRDQILLEEAPEAKRRRRVAEDGTTIAHMGNKLKQIADCPSNRGTTPAL